MFVIVTVVQRKVERQVASSLKTKDKRQYQLTIAFVASLSLRVFSQSTDCIDKMKRLFSNLSFKTTQASQQSLRNSATTSWQKYTAKQKKNMQIESYQQQVLLNNFYTISFYKILFTRQPELIDICSRYCAVRSNQRAHYQKILFKHSAMSSL